MRFPRVALGLTLASCTAAPRPPERPWLDAGIEAGRWLASVAVETEKGLGWRADPLSSDDVDRTLYAGSPGVVLLFIELAQATGDERWLAYARGGADDLCATLPEQVAGEAAGLYTGVAGVGYALGETWLATGDARYRDGLKRAFDALVAGSRRASDREIVWGDCNDVISGAAGIGFFLLWPPVRERWDVDFGNATDLGNSLLARAERGTAGLEWPMEPSYPRRMPNYSHGTAGVAAFLARLHRCIPFRGFGDAAADGGAYLESIADRSDQGFRVCHHAPGGEDLYYFGWCHGPCGTARLFRGLYEIRGDGRWRDLELACALSVMSSGLPERRLPGFWDNVSRCCGDAGVIEFMLDLWRETGDGRYLDFARRCARSILERGVLDEQGLRWPQAEHRARPELIQAQTGLMQGAAGIALALLHLDEVERGVDPRIRLPDE